MGARERHKGASAEREVAAIYRAAFPHEAVQRASGGTRQESGDLIRVPFALVSVKRHETLRLPLWTREAAAEAEPLDLVPIVAHRRSREPWYATLPLTELADLQRLAFLARAYLATTEELAQ